VIEGALAGDTDAAFHLAAVVSAGAEADFDLGYRVNLDGTCCLLEACRG
jgi:D-erythronate 2-dehydrogenase